MRTNLSGYPNEQPYVPDLLPSVPTDDPIRSYLRDPFISHCAWSWDPVQTPPRDLGYKSTSAITNRVSENARLPFLVYSETHEDARPLFFNIQELTKRPPAVPYLSRNAQRTLPLCFFIMNRFTNKKCLVFNAHRFLSVGYPWTQKHEYTYSKNPRGRFVHWKYPSQSIKCGPCSFRPDIWARLAPKRFQNGRTL